MRKPLIICIVFAIAGALTASLASATHTRTVKVGDNYFYKSTPRVPKITVQRNTIVRFKFVGDSVHNVVGYRGDTKTFGPSPIRDSGYYKKKMTKAGTFLIVCDIHGEYDQSMKIRVRS